MPAPLDGLRVLDLTRILAGPWCTQMLADFGADVIKIENPDGGDDTRSWGPPFLKDKDGNETKEAAYYLSANRNKRSMTVNMRTEEGKEIIRELAKTADIVVENFKVGGLAKLGLGEADLRALNPRLIYASITGFGQTGPKAPEPGYDYLIQGLGGIMSITGNPEGMPGAGPQRVGIAVSDLTTGMYTTIAILAALQMRERTGRGQYIDMALLDVTVGWLGNQALNYFIGGQVPQRTGPWHPNLAPYQPFPCSDGEVIVACGNDRQFRILTRELGIPDLADDPRFVTVPDRNKHRIELAGIIAERMREKPRAHWLTELPKAGVPCSGLNTIDKVFEEPQVIARGMKVDVPHPLSGTAPGVANPIKFSEAVMEYRRAAPLLGEHTEEVLRDVLGKDEASIKALREAGAL
ncbi:MAG: CaiB/BaiF CoA-transferase family protein [Pseudomonadota bacterium]|nr:CaiB/BaiF CoA-transferase family protein [Pseudomonadota bacterium]